MIATSEEGRVGCHEPSTAKGAASPVGMTLSDAHRDGGGVKPPVHWEGRPYKNTVQWRLLSGGQGGATALAV